MNVIKKSVIAGCLLVLTALSAAYSQSTVVVRKPTGDEYWYILKQAQDYYDYCDYGRAISFAEQAKNKRKALVEWEQYTLDQAQRSYSVRTAGDDLKLVRDALQKAKLNNALEIVNSYISAYGSARFGDSFSKLLAFIDRNDSYPEADYLIGRVYKIEGEIKKAELYMNKAYDNFELLSVPDMKYDILYDMADMAKSQLDSMNYSQYLQSKKTSGYYADYEKYMTGILADDDLFSKPAVMNSMVKVISSKDKKTMDRFFELYRSDRDMSLEALIGLASYYRTSAAYVQTNDEVRAELNKALKCAALGCIIAVTRINDTLDDRLTDYSYENLSDLLKKCGRYSDIIHWGDEHGVWELFCVLAEVSSDLGYKNFSDPLLNVLAQNNPDSYWQDWALRRIASGK